MLDNFAKKPVAISMCTFSIVLVGTTLYTESFDQSIFSVSESNMVYVPVTECDIGKVVNQSLHNVRINRKHITYTHELPRKKF